MGIHFRNAINYDRLFFKSVSLWLLGTGSEPRLSMLLIDSLFDLHVKNALKFAGAMSRTNRAMFEHTFNCHSLSLKAVEHTALFKICKPFDLRGRPELSTFSTMRPCLIKGEMGFAKTLIIPSKSYETRSHRGKRWQFWAAPKQHWCFSEQSSFISN